MSDITIPEDLTPLSDDDLNALAANIQTAAEALRETAATDDAALASLETLATQYQSVVDEMALREEATMGRQERAQSALDKIGGAIANEEAVESPETEGGEAEILMAADPEGTVTLSDEAEAEAEVVAEVEVEAEVVAEAVAEVATEETAVEEVEGDAVEASELAADGAVELAIPHDPAKGRVPSDPEAVPTADDTHEEAAVADEISSPEAVADPVAALSTARPSAFAPARRESGPRRALATFADSGIVSATSKGEQIDRRRLAELISQKHSQLSRLSNTTAYEPIILASARANFSADEVLGSGHEENLSIIQRATQQGEALVASGGNCAPLTPNYDVFNVAEAQSPIEGALPTVGAPRGGVRYITPPAWTEASTGVRVTTNTQDLAGYTNQTPAGTTAPKPCVHLTCSAIVECQVDAVSACATFGNLQYRTFPEQIEVFLDHLAISAAQTKEISYLDAIQTGSTAVTTTPPYGAARGTVFALSQAANAYRKRNHMPVDSVVDVLLPDTMAPFVKADMVNDLHMGLGFLNANPFTVGNEMMAAMNLNVTWYFDYATTYGSTNAQQAAQAAGGLNPWPTVYRAFMYAPGTWIRLDGGTLDVGIVRDSTLNSQNDLQMFSEEWVQVCKVGVESVRLDLTLCPDGSGPAPITALVCAS